MPRKKTAIDALRAVALRYPEATDGISCAGTAAERKTVMARNKAFLFLGEAEVMLKLADSLPEATKRAKKDPAHYKVGVHGWVTVTLDTTESAPLDLLERWLDESYRLLATKQLVALLSAAATPKKASAAKATTKTKRTPSR